MSAIVAGHAVLSPWRAGSMAELYLVRSPEGEVRLLKRPRQGFGAPPACLLGFETEQMLYAHLTGPHVPCCYASGEDEVGPYLILERIEGVALSEHAAQAPLPVEEIVRIGRRLADALHALHRQNVVHHDLTMSHVLLRPDGLAVLIDFGLACHGALPDLLADEKGVMLGTPAIIAPEQLLGVRGDPRSDLYAAGCLLYRLATGRYPFGEATHAWDRQRRRWFDPPAPRKLRPELPAWLEAVLLRCLAVRPERRYASAAQLAHDLAHPEQVAPCERSCYGWRGCLELAVKRAWAERTLVPRQPNRPVGQLERAPHVLVAIDPEATDEALAERLRTSLQRLIAHDPHWRVTCMTVLEPSLLTEQDASGELERSFTTARLAALHHWARPLALPPERLRFHVATGQDAASAIIAYAAAQHVDHIVIGARGASSLRRLLGSVSSRVATEAPCSVTVVRR